MAELGPEGLVTEIKAYLTANLAAKLIAVDARFSDLVQPANMTEWRIDDPLEGRLPDQLPMGWVVAVNSKIDQWGPTYDNQNSDVVVWVLISDSETQTLRKKIYRTALAVWEVLKAGSFDNTISWEIVGEMPEMDFSEILSGQNGLLYSDARIRVTMFKQETA